MFMNLLQSLNQTGARPLQRVRRNHALEHATLQVIAQKRPDLGLAGYSDPNGFWVIGEIGLEELQRAADKALSRLQAGEVNLAIHPNCGTNLVAQGALAGTAGMLAMLGTGSDARRKLDRWPLVVAFATLGLMAAQPLGPLMQQKLTTSTDVAGLRIKEITRYQRRGVPLHRVLTES